MHSECNYETGEKGESAIKEKLSSMPSAGDSKWSWQSLLRGLCFQAGSIKAARLTVGGKMMKYNGLMLGQRRFRFNVRNNLFSERVVESLSVEVLENWGMWFSRHGGDGLMIELDDLSGLLQPSWFWGRNGPTGHSSFRFCSSSNTVVHQALWSFGNKCFWIWGSREILKTHCQQFQQVCLKRV